MDEKIAVRVAFIADDNANGEVTAVFDEKWESANGIYSVCYAHVGQHGPCSQDWAMSCREATPAEYANLLKELNDLIGYDVEVVRLDNIKWA